MDPSQSILIVLHDFSLGGTERIAVRLAATWARLGAAVTIFAGSDAGPLRALAGPSVRVVVSDPVIAREPGSRARLAKAARAFARKSDFDAIFVPGNFHWPIAAAVAGRGSPVIAQVSAALDKPQRGPLRQWVFEMRMRRLLRRADALVTLSDVARDQADRILFRPAARTIALPALADDTPPPVSLPQSNAPVIMAAGRLVPEKGFSRLITAFAALPRRAARLVIVGDGPQLAALRSQSEALGVADRVEFPGYVADIRPWLDRANLFVLSSAFEGFPAVIVEALAAGRPVVATDCTPAVRLLAGGAGRVVPIDDTAALTDAIAAMLDQPPDAPASLAGLVEQHRIGVVAQAYLDLFSGLRR